MKVSLISGWSTVSSDEQAFDLLSVGVEESFVFVIGGVWVIVLLFGDVVIGDKEAS